MELLKSKSVAWAAFALVIIVMVLTFTLRPAWWAFIDIFFAFMAAFINVVVVTVRKINPVVARQLNLFTLVFLLLWIVSFIGEWIAYFVIYS